MLLKNLAKPHLWQQSIRNLKILFLCDSFNGLGQAAMCQLQDRGHQVSVELAISSEKMRQAVQTHQPNLILAPMLTSVIPEDIYQATKCLVVHPGIVGDRGPSSLDWAIINGHKEWGVTVLEAVEEMDAGPIWATRKFPMPTEGSKSSIYNNLVTPAALDAINEAVDKFQVPEFEPKILDYTDTKVKGRLQPTMQQADRRINWETDSTEEIKRKIDASDGRPGVLDANILPEPFFLFGAHTEGLLKGGKPGEILGRRHGAVCVSTIDGAIWISHLKKKGKGNFKLPATVAARQYLQVEELTVPATNFPILSEELRTYKEIWFEEFDKIGVLNFEFYNGAMSTKQCKRLAEACLNAISEPIDVLILLGGQRHAFSNGIHLNLIEAAEDPAQEAWDNINAINDFVGHVLSASNKVTISAIGSNAGAGGIMMALASDFVVARRGIVLNPHYATMGLHGSEYWTYSLSRRVGELNAKKLTTECLPLDTEMAFKMGLVDRVFDGNFETFRNHVLFMADHLQPNAGKILAEKNYKLDEQEKLKPLSRFAQEELEQMKTNMFDDNLGFSEARKNFVYKRKALETPRHLVSRNV